MNNNSTGHDARYELRAVGLLTIAFGLVGIDRFAMNYMFPAMRADLGLTYQDLGNASAVLSLALGLAAVVAGPLIGRYGARAVVVPSVLTFSMAAGLSGLVQGLPELLVLRFVMGLADGAFATACIVASLNAAAPTRKALVNGTCNAGMSVIGLGLGPIIITNLLILTDSWRLSFFIIPIPGFIVAALLWRTLHDKEQEHLADQERSAGHEVHSGGFLSLLRYPNVWICMGVQTLVVGSLVVVVTMTPSYVVDVLKLSEQAMGSINSAVGFGTVAGALVITALSDRLGRKPVIVGCTILAAVAVYFFYITGPDLVLLFIALALIAALCFATLYIVVGPTINESVPLSLAAVATGLIIAVGEILGGAGAPAVAGYVAQQFGLAQVYLISLGGLVCAFCLALFLKTGALRGAVPADRAIPQPI